jgi:CRISPR-associated protein Cas5h
LKNPRFRIFVGFQNKALLNELSDSVKANRSYFTPYLGLSQFTAGIRFQSVEEVTPVKTEVSTAIVTAVNLNQGHSTDPIQFNYTTDFKYTSDTMPVAMQKDRIVTEYAEVVVETNGNPINIKSSHTMQVANYGNILFL